MIVLLQANSIGFSAMDIALMFTLYEAAGVVTNLLAGVAGARWGIKITLLTGLVLQIAGLGMLLAWDKTWGKPTAIVYVTLAQMLCGVAKDLVKLGGKIVSKLVTPEDKEGELFHLVAMITGWKNSFKGAGYFFGSVLVLWETGPNGFFGALFVLMGMILLAMPWAALKLSSQLGRDPNKQNATLKQVFALPDDATEKDRRNQWNRNWLSLGRCFLFASRDCWFEVPLPLFLRDAAYGLGWSRPAAGAVLGGYIILYGQVQAHSEYLLRPLRQFDKQTNVVPHKWHVILWALLLVPPLIWMGSWVHGSAAFACVGAGSLTANSTHTHTQAGAGLVVCSDADMTVRTIVVLAGVVSFGMVFGINSAINSGLIAGYSTNATAAKNIGFYYMSNAAGRLLGTLLSGVLYSNGHFGWCFWASVLCLLVVCASSLRLRDPGVLRCGKRCHCCADPTLPDEQAAEGGRGGGGVVPDAPPARGTHPPPWDAPCTPTGGVPKPADEARARARDPVLQHLDEWAVDDGVSSTNKRP